MAIEQEKLAKAAAALWIFLSIPISQDFYDEALDGGFFMRVFALLAVAAPVWLVFGWRWLTNKAPFPRMFWVGIAVVGLLTTIIWANDYDLDEIAYIPLITAGAFIALVWVYERSNMLCSLKVLTAIKSRKVRDTLNALYSLRPLFDEEENAHTAIAADKILSVTRTTVKQDAERTIYSISNDKWSPRDLALLLISKASSNALTSGHYHIYRGVLSGEGNGYLAVFSTAIHELVKSGFITPEEAEEDLRSVREEIKSVG